MKRRVDRPATRWPGIASLGGTRRLYRQGERRLWAASFATISPRRACISNAGGDERPGTARCLILVTPDAQRTMNTYLGACVDLGPDRHGPRPDRVRRKSPISKAICTTAPGEGGVSRPRPSPMTRAARWRSRCPTRSASSVIAPISATWSPAMSTSCSPTKSRSARSTDRDFAAAAAAVRGQVAIAAVTRSADGSVILADGEEHRVAAAPVARVVDSTGAGDLYAAGFLHGLTRGCRFPFAATSAVCALQKSSAMSAPGPSATCRNSWPRQG